MPGFTVLAFPGQGAQKVGMGVDFAQGNEAAQAVFEAAGRALGYDLLALCANGPASALVPTDVQQPAILTVSAAAVEAMRTSGRMPDGAIRGAFGLSLGEFTALWAAGSLSLKDALILVRERGLGMQEASAAAPSGMSALRCEEAVAEEACAQARAQTGGVCVVANLNAPGQVVISGDLPTLAAAEEAAKPLGVRRAVRLEVAGAFHSPLMAPGARRLEATLKDIEVKKPSFPVWSNVTGAASDDPQQIRRNLIAQVTSPVRFVACVQAARAGGMTRAIEPAPGVVLSGLISRIEPGVEIVSSPDFESMTAMAAGSAS